MPLRVRLTEWLGRARGEVIDTIRVEFKAMLAGHELHNCSCVYQCGYVDRKTANVRARRCASVGGMHMMGDVVDFSCEVVNRPGSCGCNDRERRIRPLARPEREWLANHGPDWECPLRVERADDLHRRLDRAFEVEPDVVLMHVLRFAVAVKLDRGL